MYICPVTLSEMRKILAERQLQLTKSLGQNFLHDGNQLRRILGMAELTPADRVLEIGPGLGPLTAHLLEAAGEVLAIETDFRLVEILRERFRSQTRNSQKLRLIHADALAYLRDERRDWTGWKLVANLPYSVASPILVELASSPAGPERLVATLQSEVAARLMARPGTADYGVLTLLVQLNYVPSDSFRIPATCFFPEPDVASSCVCLVRRSEPLLEAPLRAQFVALVKQAFSQRRKMMFKLLKARWPADVLESAFSLTGIDLRVRAEQLSLTQLTQLTRCLASGTNTPPANPVDNEGARHGRPKNSSAISDNIASQSARGEGREDLSDLPQPAFKQLFQASITPASPAPDSDPAMSPTGQKTNGTGHGDCVPPAGSEELFDVVNQKDEVIDQRPRSEVHRLGLMHRAVHVLVFNRSGEIFLQKRSMNKDRQPGVWDSSASGHLAPGEAYEAAARRELKEEIGLTTKTPLQPLFKLAASAETDQEHVWIYRCESEGPFALDAFEVEAGAWFSPRRVTSWMTDRPEDFASAFRVIWTMVQDSDTLAR